MAGPSRDHEILTIAGRLDALYPGTGYGRRFTAIADANPTWPVARVEDAFAAQVSASAMKAALRTGLATGGKATGQLVTGASTGAAAAAGTIANPFAAIGNFFSSLGQASLWIRVGEVLLGIVLVAIGVARITDAVPAVSAIARTAGAVAVL